MLTRSRRQDLVQALQALAARSRAVERHPSLLEELATFMPDDTTNTGQYRNLILLKQDYAARRREESGRHGKAASLGRKGGWHLGGEGARVPSEEMIRAATPRTEPGNAEFNDATARLIASMADLTRKRQARNRNEGGEVQRAKRAALPKAERA